MSKPNSFRFLGREGRKYRVALNPQRGYWFAAFHDGNGRQRVSLGARTKAEAEAAVKLLDAPPVKQNEPAKLTWPEFQGKYLAYKTEQGKAVRTVERYKAALDALGRYLASVQIATVDEITLLVLEGYVPYRTNIEKRGVKTAYTDALAIKNALKWGSKASRGLLKVNPALDWETQEPVRPKGKTYTQEQVAKLEAGVRDWLKPVVATLAWTGLRIGELVNLRWKDVDLQNHVLHIRVREDWKPKGKADRTVPLHPKVETVLRAQPIGEYAFLGPRAGRIKENYALLCLKADQRRIAVPECGLHGFRRFFATTMLRSGVDVETVRQWGGWKSLETMLRYLADVDVKDSVQAMETAARRLATA